MRRFALIPLVLTFLSLVSEASDPAKSAVSATGATKTTAPTKANSQFNSQVYEQNDNTENFTAIVKVVREVQGETEVFFQGRQGYYVLGNPSLQERLVKSQQKTKPVSVQIDSSARNILNVEFKD
jgi:hypothetical protein